MGRRPRRPPSAPACRPANGAVSGYTVSVTATTQMPTTFMSLLISSVAVTASATAVNPVSQVTLDGSGIADNFKTSACDLNTIYYYLTSDNNTIPNPSTFTSSQMVGTNGTTNNPAGVVQCVRDAEDRLRAEERDRRHCATTATTSTARRRAPPTGSSPPLGRRRTTRTTRPRYQAVTTNHSFYTTTTSTPNTVLTATGRRRRFSTPPTYPTVTCQQVGTQYVNYYWNDMGGNIDDLDYNDMEYSLNCTPVSGGSHGGSTVASVQPVYLSR